MPNNDRWLQKPNNETVGWLAIVNYAPLVAPVVTRKHCQSCNPNNNLTVIIKCRSYKNTAIELEENVAVGENNRTILMKTFKTRPGFPLPKQQ